MSPPDTAHDSCVKDGAISTIPLSMTRSDMMKIMSHLEKEKVFRTVRRMKQDGTTRSRVVSETLWWKMPDCTIKSTVISETLPPRYNSRSLLEE